MASTTPTTLTINAAFLQEIKEDHHELRELLDATRKIASDRHPPIDRLTDTLVRLRDRVSLHFALEEAYGYCDAAVDQAPWMSEKAATLRAQHVDLFLTLGKRVDDAERMRYHESPRRKLGPLRHRVLAFCDELDEHERREVELILAAFDDDVGVGD